MKKIGFIFVSFIALTISAIEVNCISFTNNTGKVTKIAIVGKVDNVKVSCGTNNIPYIVTTTNIVEKISK